MLTKTDVHKKICRDLNELYVRKNADYGDSFGKSFEEYGLTMSCIRLEDKLNRIKSLSKHEAQVSDESIIDTLMDLANYSIMTLVELDLQKINAPDAHHVAKRGTHDPNCHKSCLCMTCVHDHMNGRPCCNNTHGLVCPITECPNYEKEDTEQ